MQKRIASLSWLLIASLVGGFVMMKAVYATAPKARTAATPTKAADQAPATQTKGAAKEATKKSAQKQAAQKAAKVDRKLPSFLVGLTIFILAIFIGFELISKVPPLLHSPLMSGANAISGVTIVGALVCARTGSFGSLAAILGLLAVICAMANVVGGFMVTDRMMQMYLKKK